MNSLFNALQSALNDKSSFERAEACYNAVFRTTLTKFFADFEEEMRWEIEQIAAQSLASKDGLIKPDFDCPEYEYDDYCEKLESYYEQINQDSIFCYTCNYKGEGLGWVLLDDAANLPLFKSKNASFELFNC